MPGKMLFSYQLIIQLITQLRNPPFAGSRFKETAEEGQARRSGGFRLLPRCTRGALFLRGVTR